MSKMYHILYYIGIVVVFITHIYMYLKGIPGNLIKRHAIINLVAALLMSAGWFTNINIDYRSAIRNYICERKEKNNV